MLRLNLNSFLPCRITSLRVAGAWLCLAAVVILWMPVLAAAWNAHVMACCDGKMCTTQGHRHSKPTEKPSGEAAAPMDCGHSQNASTMSCAMSCCHEQEQFTSAGTIFVLPEAAPRAELSLAESSVLLPDAKQIASLFGPLSPPPRSNPSIA
jgi:hypothetical protein